MTPGPEKHSEVLRHLLKKLPVQVWSVDPELRFNYLKGMAVEEVTGGSLQRYVGAPLQSILTPETLWVADLHRAAFKGEPQTYQASWGGRTWWAHLRLSPSGNEVAGIALDVTGQAENRMRLEHLFTSLPLGVVFQDASGKITDANATAQEILGLTLDELTGRTSVDPAWKAIHEDGTPFPGEDHPGMVALREKRPTRAVMGVNNPMTGHYRWIRVAAVPRLDPEGEPVELFAAFEDITDRKAAEDALERSRALLLKTGRLARIGGWEVDLETGRVDWSEVTREIHEVDEAYDPTIEDAFSFYPGEARQRIEALVRGAIDDGTPYDEELPFVSAKGKELWIHTLGTPEHVGGRCVRLHGTFQDITDRRNRELELERTSRARRFVSASHAALVRGLEGDDLLERIFQVAIDEGGYAHVWIASRTREASSWDVHQAPQGASIDLMSLEGLAAEIDGAFSAGVALAARGLADGEGVWERHLAGRGLGALVILPFPKEAPLEGFLALAHHDSATLTTAEVEILNELVSDLAYGLWVRSIRQELFLVREAVANLSVGIAILEATAEGLSLAYVNSGFTEVTGYPAREALGKSWDFIFGSRTEPTAQARIEAGFREGEGTQVSLEMTRRSGERFWSRLTIEPVRDEYDRVSHFVAILEDVSEARRMGLELEHRARLSAVGELAGGVAHDFRNILTAAEGLIQLSLSEVDEKSSVRENLGHMSDLVSRGTSVTERLLALSRRHEGEPCSHELGAVLTRAVDFIDRMVRDDIEVVLEEPPESVRVLLDEDQFATMVLNLARNSVQAMPGGGSLSFTVLYPVKPGGPAWWPPDLHPDSPDPWVRVSVRDTGAGMDAETLEHAFDPYFTTKPVGEGTGLGLPMVYGIVDRWGGRVWLESEVGKGTTVHLLLPTTDAVVEPKEVDARTGSIGHASSHRGATILLAEDDPAVLRVFRRGLERAGHTVLAGTDGLDALQAFEADPDAVELVVTDGLMPRMSGASLAQAIWERRPDLTVILTSGFASREVLAQFDGEVSGDLVLLPKPLTIDQLLASVQARLSMARTEIA